MDPNLLGQIGSLADDFRLDESWDQNAMNAGKTQANTGEIKQTSKYDIISDFYKDDYEDFIKNGGNEGEYKPSIQGMLKHIKEYEETADE